MTKMNNVLRDYVQELFAGIGRISVANMFGGSGVYSGEDMFALVHDERIYIKADEALKADLEDEGGQPFEWTNPDTGRTIQMSYVSMPVNAMDDPGEATDWGKRALNVAIEARRAKVKSPRRRPF